mmetsp:Transcript_20321/g.63707  ORF Transcript_20321/g.63707 Transcript_20321/m.63707 type:complete len:188 (-) Transcript_20321:86-649(-)
MVGSATRALSTNLANLMMRSRRPLQGRLCFREEIVASVETKASHASMHAGIFAVSRSPGTVPAWGSQTGDTTTSWMSSSGSAHSLGSCQVGEDGDRLNEKLGDDGLVLVELSVGFDGWQQDKTRGGADLVLVELSVGVDGWQQDETRGGADLALAVAPTFGSTSTTSKNVSFSKTMNFSSDGLPTIS